MKFNFTIYWLNDKLLKRGKVSQWLLFFHRFHYSFTLWSLHNLKHRRLFISILSKHNQKNPKNARQINILIIQI